MKLHRKRNRSVTTTRRSVASPPRNRRWLLQFCVCGAFMASAAIEGRSQDVEPATRPSADQQQPEVAAAKQPDEFKKMSLDELMNVEVTSVSRRESTIGQSAAAISVITQDDIRRSGATSIPEALRMVPGMNVAQIDASNWAISARGFNNNTANKLLVLMDGRSVYTPLFSGVFWDVQDTMMQDVDRIEVIRGPAGAVWGANAVNGVINVITKDAKDTQGALVTGGGGSELRDFGAAQYGWQVKDDVFARIYVKHADHDETVFRSGAPGQDDWSMTQSGFRLDGQPSPDNHYTLQGDIYSGETDLANSSENTDLAGGNILGRVTQKMSDGSDVKLQMYYDRTQRDIPATFVEHRDTFDIDFQYHVPIGKQHDVTMGLGYRYSTDAVGNRVITFVPDRESLNLFSAFIQDEIQLVPEKLRLTLGSKFEHNDFSGFEIEPSARLLWTITKRQTAWVAVSRAVRTPTQLETDLTIVAPGASLIGNKDFDSEVELAYEAGYRIQPVDWLAVDIAAFYNNYDDLRSLELNGTIFSEENKLNGQTYGVEIGSTVQPTEWWTIRAAYTFLNVQVQTDPGSTDVSSESLEGNDPRNQYYVRSSFDLPYHFELDCTWRYVGELETQGVPSYMAFDARLGWHPTDQLELAVVGQNLFDNRHPEFGTGAAQHEIERGVYAMFTYKW